MNRDRKLEALLEAFAEMNNSRRPEDAAFHAKNPMRLQEFTPEGKATGRLRRFESLHGGILSGLYDLRVKCSGKSRAKLDGDNFTIRGLVRVYSLHDINAQYICRFLKKALNDPSINPDTKLSYFVEDEVVTNSARAETREQVMTNG